MATLPPRFVSVIVPFATLFRQRRTWAHARLLLAGAILAPGARTVTAALCVLGRTGERHWVNYHRVLSRAIWSPRTAGRVLLGLVVRTLAPTGPLVFGIDDTLERRRGRRIRAAGSFRDPVRSTQQRVVNAWGLRWLSAMLLTPVPWAGSLWAMPILTALAPNAQAAAVQGRRHKPLTTWARQLMRQLSRWCAVTAPGRAVVVVADQSFAALDLIAPLAPRMTWITRLRLDARLFAPLPPPDPAAPRRRGRPPRTGPRLPRLSEVLTAPTTHWTRVTLTGWYGGTAQEMELATGTAVWFQYGKPLLPLRWVLVRDPRGTLKPHNHRPSSRRTSRSVPRRSSATTCGAGAWRSPSPRRAATSASRPSASGPTVPSRARPRSSSASSRS
ncbi:MAG TPA: transposase [Gemmatimonadales bacterium]